MALSFSERNPTLEVISSQDEAVTCDSDTYQEYLKSLDESLLALKDGLEPTRFVLRTMFTYKQSKQLKDMQVEIEDGKPKARISYIMPYVRYALIDIKNPGSGLEFKRGSDGSASEELVNLLTSAGIDMELFQARESYLSKKDEKKS